MTSKTSKDEAFPPQMWKRRHLDCRLDLPRAELSKIVVIASVPRSGSNMLGEDLRLTEKAGVPREYLHGKIISGANFHQEYPEGSSIRTPRRRAGWLALMRLKDPSKGLIAPRSGPASSRAIEAYLRRVIDRRTTPNGVFSIKIHGYQMAEMLALRPPVTLEKFGVPISWIRLTRRDKLGQAISWVRALQTDAWVHRDDVPSVVYDEAAIQGILGRIDYDERFWDNYFAERSLTPLNVTYEEYVKDRSAGLQEIGEFAGLGSLSHEGGTTLRQSDEITEEWRSRFLATNPASGGGEACDS